MTVIAAPDARDVYGWISPAPDYRAGLDDGVRGLRIAYSPTLGGIAKRVHPEVASRRGGGRASLRRPRRHGRGGRSRHGRRPHRCLEHALVVGDGAASCSPSRDRAAELADPGLLAGAAQGADDARHRTTFAPSSGAPSCTTSSRSFHERYDLLLTPALPLPAFEVGHLVPPSGDWGTAWTDWAPFSYPFNLTQQPAASVPCGLTGDGLPVGPADRRPDRRRRPGAARQPRLRGRRTPSPCSTRPARTLTACRKRAQRDSRTPNHRIVSAAVACAPPGIQPNIAIDRAARMPHHPTQGCRCACARSCCAICPVLLALLLAGRGARGAADERAGAGRPARRACRDRARPDLLGRRAPAHEGALAHLLAQSRRLRARRPPSPGSCRRASRPARSSGRRPAASPSRTC